MANSMSIRKTKTKENSYSFKNEIMKSFGKRKIEAVGIITALLLVIFDFLTYAKDLYSIFMLIFLTIFVLYYFSQSIYLYTKLRLSLKVLKANPDFKMFQETIEKLTTEQLETFQKIQQQQQQIELDKAKKEEKNDNNKKEKVDK